LIDFFRHTCKLHASYNTDIETNSHRIRLNTIANVCREMRAYQFNEDTAYEDFSIPLAIVRQRYFTTSRAAKDEFCLCVIDEYSTICPAIFVIITKLFSEIFYKTIFIVCGDKRQCGPIECSNVSSLNKNRTTESPQTINHADFEKEALPRDLCELAKHLLGPDRVVEYTLNTLVRAASDENLQRLITAMWTDADQHVDDRKTMIRDFMIRFNVADDNVINISTLVDNYVRLIATLETNDQEAVERSLRSFEIPFKIIATANNTLNEIDERLITAVFEKLQSIYDTKTLQKYIRRYTIDDEHDQYLLVGFPYKITQNLLRSATGSYDLSNGKTVQLVVLEFDDGHDGGDDKLKSVIVKDRFSDVADENAAYRLYPMAGTTNNRFKDETTRRPIIYTGFPLQLYCSENVFQVQGLTVHGDVYLDCDCTNNEHLYVMFSRFQNISQLKTVINL
jgi:hypothetical protein